MTEPVPRAVVVSKAGGWKIAGESIIQMQVTVGKVFPVDRDQAAARVPVEVRVEAAEGAMVAGLGTSLLFSILYGTFNQY